MPTPDEVRQQRMDQAFEARRLGQTNSPRNSSRPRRIDLCEFCGEERPRIGNDFFSIPGPCACPEGSRHYQEEQERVQRERAEREESLRRERVQTQIRKSLLPQKFLTRTWDGFQVTDANRQAFIRAKQYADTFDRRAGKGLVFIGTVGTGKTHLCAAIALQLLEGEHSVMFGTVATLLGQIRSTYDSQQSEREVFNRMTKCDLLIIDDMGKERVTEWGDTMLYELVNTRYENNKAILFTTNNTLSDIRTKYPNSGEAIVSRVLEMCEGIKMTGPDWRKKAIQ